MGMYPRAHVAYGFFLGSPSFGWELEGLGEYGELNRPWMKDDEEDCETTILRTLLLADGMAPGDLAGKESWELEDPLMERRNLELVGFGHGGYADYNYVLGAGREQRASAYVPEPINLVVSKDADENLAWALRALDLVPKQQKAAWLSFPSYG